MRRGKALSRWIRLWRHPLKIAGKAQALPAPRRSRPAAASGDWLSGRLFGADGLHRFRLFRPPRLQAGERLPLLVMLHGCGQDAARFAQSTRMNRIAARERFLVLYPEQDRRHNLHGCWNWFDTDSGRAHAEAALIIQAIDQVCLLHPVDRDRVAIAGLSSGASMAALLATRYPSRFKAVVMHSGIPPGAAHSLRSALSAMQGRPSLRPPSLQSTLLAPQRPPLMVIQGRADAVVAASNGRAAAQQWALALGAHAAAARRLQRGRRYAMTVTDFKRRRATLATLVEVDRLGHAWSGGAASQPFGDAAGPDASRMVWAFAAKQFGA